jgi:hypothetical protein
MEKDNILHYFLPTEILCHIFSKCLSLQDICRLDTAVCNNIKWSRFLSLIGSVSCIWLGDKEKQFISEKIHWLSIRNMKISHLNCGDDQSLLDKSDFLTRDTVVKVAGFGAYIQWLNLDGQGITDAGMIKIAENCPIRRHLSLARCENVTDASM